MRNRFDYMIIEEKTAREVSALVRRFMYDGWWPHGPLVHGQRYYLQAMIRVEHQPAMR